MILDMEIFENTCRINGPFAGKMATASRTVTANHSREELNIHLTSFTMKRGEII